ncbi:MAG: TerB family tellurite resistance protein [Bacteroidota bacterium]
MLNAIKQFFEQNMTADLASTDPAHQLKLATAALLIEMMHQDEKVLDVEQNTVKNALKETFQLTENETHELFQLAEEEVHHATDYYQFTRLIADHYTQQQKIQVIELLWQVAYADNHLDAYEEHMVRRISDLIYVPHHDFIKAKLKVQSQISG